MKITCIFDFTLLLSILAFGRNDHKHREMKEMIILVYSNILQSKSFFKDLSLS